MSRSGLPRWAAFAMLPLLVGAVLLMHGLDAGTSTPVTAGTAGEHHHDTGTDHGRGCDSCPGPHHALMVCVAVVATIGTCRTARHLGSRLRVVVPALRTQVSRAGALVAEVARPPVPGWVRLGVMRC